MSGETTDKIVIEQSFEDFAIAIVECHCGKRVDLGTELVGKCSRCGRKWVIMATVVNDIQGPMPA